MKTLENLSLTDINRLYNKQTDHFLIEFKSIQVEKYPFLHIESQRLFDKEFYQYIKCLAPSLEDMDIFADQDGVPKDYPRERKSFFIKTSHDGHKQLYNKDLDARMRYQYVRLYDWFNTVLLEKFFNMFDLDLAKKTHDEFAFMADLSGFGLRAHTDIPQKVMTVLLYMPDDESLEAHGTRILIPKTEEVLNKPRKNDNDFEILKVTKFVPNNLFSFKRSDISFHSVGSFDGNNPRRFLLYTAMSA